MNRRTILSAFALAALLSCQNQSAAPSAPQGETGTLALRLVSTTALAQAESVTVRLSWGSDMKVERAASWDAPSIKLDGLPLGVRITVHMEGWNDERGRHVVVWSGDAVAQLSGDVDWDLNNEAPIVIVPAAPAATPNLATMLPTGYALVGDSLRLWLEAGKVDTIRLGCNRGDSVFLDDKNLVAVDGKFPIALASGERHQVVVVGANGMTASFRVAAATKLPSARELVVANAARSWSNDTLSFSLPEGASDTVRIGTSGVDSVLVNDKKVQPAGASYGIVATAPGSYAVVACGAAGQSAKFVVMAFASQKAEVKPGLVADFEPALPSWAGSICPLRVAMDSGKVDRVVMVKPEYIEFTKVNDSLWKLDWNTSGVSDSLEVHVYGVGSKGADSVLLGKRVSFDREAPSIRVADLTSKGFRFGKAGGTVSWNVSDRGVATTWATDTGNAKLACSGDSCRVTDVRKSFVIHARDNLGNDTSLAVPVAIDAVGPEFTSVKDVAGNALGNGDVLWIDSAVGSGAVSVAATDDLSGIEVVAERGAPQGSIQERIVSGSAAISGLTVGTWALRAVDDLGNETLWGNLEVKIRPAGAVVILGANLKALPKWVGKSCSVQVAATSGTIDSVVATGLQFLPNDNKTIWSAVWAPSKNSGLDTLNLTVHGQGSKGPDSIKLQGVVSVDREAPANVEVTDGLGRMLGDNGYVFRDTTTGVAKLVVKAADSSGFLVRLMSGTTPLRTVAGVNGVATLDSLPAGTFAVVLEDSLGNVFVRDGKTAWGNVVVRPWIAKPRFSKPAGTYGAGSTSYNRSDNRDVLELLVTCRDGATPIWKSSSTRGWNKDPLTFIWFNGTYDFRCATSTDSSFTETRAYTVLQRPTIFDVDSTLGGSVAKFAKLVDSSASDYPKSGATIQYCVGDTASCGWPKYSEPIRITATTTVWARVSYDGAYSQLAQRIFAQTGSVTNWTRNFAQDDAPLVTDTAALRTNYQIIAWSGKPFDTLSATKTYGSALRLDMKWQIANRDLRAWGAFGADFFLDESYSKYDFTDADSIVFDYTATGTMQALHIYPVDPSDQGSDDALQYAVTGTGTSRHVRIDLVKGAELAYPSWTNGSGTKTWNDIKGSIKSLRFFVEPMNTSTDAPTEATTSLSISDVKIYGTIKRTP